MWNLLDNGLESLVVSWIARVLWWNFGEFIILPESSVFSVHVPPVVKYKKRPENGAGI